MYSYIECRVTTGTVYITTFAEPGSDRPFYVVATFTPPLDRIEHTDEQKTAHDTRGKANCDGIKGGPVSGGRETSSWKNEID